MTHRTFVRLTEREFQDVREYAEARERTVSGQIRLLIRDALKAARGRKVSA